MNLHPDSWVYGDAIPNPKKHDLIGLKANWIIRCFPQRRGLRVLDYGCGEGKHLALIRQFRPDATLVGVDIREMRANRHSVEFHILGAQGSLDFADASFDVVISCDVLEHVESVEHSLDEIRRVLRPGGAFIGFIPLEGGFGPHALFRLFYNDLYKDTKDHIRSLTKREMLDLLAARFRIVQREYSYHLFGGFMDAAFFASFKLPGIGPKMEEFWRGSENPFYRRSDERSQRSILWAFTMFANVLAYYESTIFRNISIGACGLHFHVENLK